MDLKITPSGQTIVKPTALGPVANTDTKLLIYGLFQKGRVLAQDGNWRELSLGSGALGDPGGTWETAPYLISPVGSGLRAPLSGVRGEGRPAGAGRRGA